MAEHIISGHGGSSTITLRNRLDSIRQHIKAISLSNLIRSHTYKFRSTPTEAEWFLMICSIFPDDFWIPIEDLVVYMMGLGLFEDVSDMFTARSRVYDIISIINNTNYFWKELVAESGLSHENDGPDYSCAKMLDGALDLVKSVALKYPSLFRREIIVEKWPKSNSFKACCGLSLALKNVSKHPIHLKCPKLALLQLKYGLDSQSLPIDFFKGLKELRVLSLDVPSLPQSLNALWNLRTLHLKITKFEDASSIGGLANLEFLSISVLNLTEIPRELGQLENLKYLDLRRMSVTYFPPGLLLRLLKLEELYLPVNFKNWGCMDKDYDDHDEFESEEHDGYGKEERICADISQTDDQERINASLIEIVSPSLNTLQVCVQKASVFPKSSPLFKNLKEFRILKPNNVLCQPFGKYSGNVLQLTGDIIESGVCDLLRRAEDLNLTQVQHLKNVFCQLEERGFPNLKNMIVSECDELEYIVDGTKRKILLEADRLFRNLEHLHLSMLPNLKEICHERWKRLRWFSNLSQISIRFCPKLKYLFPLSIVRGLTLKRVEILECNGMEGIFYEDKEDNIPLALFSIENLDLYSLPQLTSLLVCKDNTINEVCNDINESLTPDKEGSICIFAEEFDFSPPTSISVETLQGCATQQYISSNQLLAVKNKDAVGHLEMYSLLPSKHVAKWFRNLKSLRVAFCDSVKVVFFFEENHATCEAFNSLQVLELHGLRNLVHIWFQIPPKLMAFKNLRLLVLSDCDSSYLLSYRVAKLLVQLQKLYVSRCEKMEEIISVKDDENERTGRIMLPRLKYLELQQLPNLRVLFGGTHEIELPSLVSLRLKQCNKMNSLFFQLTRMPMLEGVEVNGSFQSLRENLYISVKGVPILHNFTFADLEIATKNFSLDNILGEGGFVKVYKGWIDKKTFAPSQTSVGMPVAIKRLIPSSYHDQGEHEWKSETEILGSKLHPNLVALLGYCKDSGEFLLVYEFNPRGTLSDHLFTINLGIKPLSWDIRIKIAIGAARGLNFLHTSDIVHRDVKASNILLDNKCNAKISGLGLAKLMPVDGESEVTDSVKGTYGYVDPAYICSGCVSVKSDVYSFGVVLLELMTGLEMIDINRPYQQIRLVDWLKPILSQKRELRKYMDSTMEGQYSFEAMSLMTDLILECLQQDPTMRPTMAEVLDKLLEIESIKQ